MASTTIKRRPHDVYDSTKWPDIPEIIERIYSARGVHSLADIQHGLKNLLSVSKLGNIDNAASLIAQAIMNDRSIMISGDYDCDGATGTSVAYRGLRMLGAQHLNFIIPNRFKHGYGLSPELVADMQPKPDLIVTVDSGVSSVEGVRAAKDAGITVVVTDHHLPPDELPDADAIVNPNLKDDGFPSKMLAGVGVMFYVLIAVSRHLRIAKWFEGSRKEPQLTDLLDLVAVGTIADLVPLDNNNRILVQAGLERIRKGRCAPGLKALIVRAGRDHERLVASDIAFSVGPRINAAGRLEDMRVGVQCLTTDDPVLADYYASQLEEINDARKERQQEMISEAEQLLLTESSGSGSADGGSTTSDDATPGADGSPGRESRHGVVLFNAAWHSGIVGLVASKVKESLYRPVVALAPAEPGSSELRGSARSIPGFHLRDALAVLDSRYPGLMKKFGGHAMAAGLSIDISKVDAFKQAFENVAGELLTKEQLEAIVYTDGPLGPKEFSLDFAYYLNTWGPWGQGFPEPCFDNEFEIIEYRVLGGRHLKLMLAEREHGTIHDAIWFNSYHGQEIHTHVHVAYELSINRWKDQDRLQLMVRHLEFKDASSGKKARRVE